MATTTNYGWTTPDDTALVKDGAAAIRTLGSSVDTTTKNLNPETTLGDLAYRSSTANVKTRLALGTANQILRVNSGATAPEWATVSSGGMTLLSTTTLSGATTTISSIDQTYVNLFILVLGVNKSNANYLYCKPLNSATNTSGNYIGTNNSGVFEGTANLNDRIRLASRNHMVASNTNNAWAVIINNYASASFYKPFSVNGTYRDDTGFDTAMGGSGGVLTTTAIDSLTFDPAAGTFNAGTVLLYGVK